LATDKQVERGISEIVGALTDPIIVMPGGWGDTLPEWIKTTITLERLVENMKAIRGEEMTGTDAEACAYLYTASLSGPMDSDWVKIYLYIAGKVYERGLGKDTGGTLPDDIRVDSLNDYQKMHLRRLKDWIYRTRSRMRLERDRAERRQQKEKAIAEKKERQPALFEF
jgi:hypothetical protein